MKDICRHCGQEIQKEFLNTDLWYHTYSGFSKCLESGDIFTGFANPAGSPKKLQSDKVATPAKGAVIVTKEQKHYEYHQMPYMG